MPQLNPDLVALDEILNESYPYPWWFDTFEDIEKRFYDDNFEGVFVYPN